MNPSNRREHVVLCWTLCPELSLQMLFLESTAQLWWGGAEKALTHLSEKVTEDNAGRTTADRLS